MLRASSRQALSKHKSESSFNAIISFSHSLGHAICRVASHDFLPDCVWTLNLQEDSITNCLQSLLPSLHFTRITYVGNYVFYWKRKPYLHKRIHPYPSIDPFIRVPYCRVYLKNGVGVIISLGHSPPST